MNRPMEAEFYERNACISCQSLSLRTLDSGAFGEEPHRTMLLNSPWGESPFPFLENCKWALVECEVCAQIFHQRVLTPEWTERRFTKWMSKEAIHEFQSQHGILEPGHIFKQTQKMTDHIVCIEKLTRGLRVKQAIRLLDFGCGDGQFLNLASAFGFDAHGIDRSTARTEHFQGQASIYEDFQAFQEHQPDPVHVVTLFEVLEHLEEPLAILNAAHEHLVPSGILVVEVPNADGVRQIKTMDDLVVDGFDHLNAFSPATLQKIVERAGFTAVKRPTAHVTADIPRIIKREIRRVVGALRKPTTQLYFRRN